MAVANFAIKHAPGQALNHLLHNNFAVYMYQTRAAFEVWWQVQHYNYTLVYAHWYYFAVLYI